jgi:hypothetical protein
MDVEVIFPRRLRRRVIGDDQQRPRQNGRQEILGNARCSERTWRSRGVWLQEQSR